MQQTSPETREGWMTPRQFGEYVGKITGTPISRARVSKLLQPTFDHPQGRIVGAVRERIGQEEAVLIPPDPRVLRARGQVRQGPIMDYINDWEKRNSILRPKPVEEKEVIDEEVKEIYLSEFFN